MTTRKQIKYYRQMERLCSEQAMQCRPFLGREALEELAKNYRMAAERLEGETQSG